MTKETGGPAFPTHPSLYSSADQAEAQGMTLRDYFAAKAMINLQNLCIDKSGSYDPTIIAKECYALADAMIAERKN